MVEIGSDVWIANVHMVAAKGERPFTDPQPLGAYTNCITRASDETEFRAKVRAMLAEEGLEVDEITDAETLADRCAEAVSDEDRAALETIFAIIEGVNLKEEVCTTDIHTYTEGFGPH